VIAPMCRYSAIDGEANDWHLIHLGHLVLSGAGLLTVEATAVEPEGRISAGDLGPWSDATEAALRQVLMAMRQQSRMPLAIELAHAGRKTSRNAPWDGGQLAGRTAADLARLYLGRAARPSLGHRPALRPA
jgi:2,4-dienoyl-CoA reductase-like NADH-dependent reductase (Old Yellow Enzyme family)